MDHINDFLHVFCFLDYTTRTQLTASPEHTPALPITSFQNKTHCHALPKLSLFSLASRGYLKYQILSTLTGRQDEELKEIK